MWTLFINFKERFGWNYSKVEFVFPTRTDVVTNPTLRKSSRKAVNVINTAPMCFLMGIICLSIYIWVAGSSVGGK